MEADNYYRYEGLFWEPSDVLGYFADVPFLNGGLFERLDHTEETTGKTLYLDGFSRNPKKRPTIPNRLFSQKSRLQTFLMLTVNQSERTKRSVAYYGFSTPTNLRSLKILQ